MSRMRLICPNCGAQYEVPVDVVPHGGRDVQCSNCGHTWFQRHPDDDPDLAEELNQPLPDQSWQPEDDAPPEPPVDDGPRRQIDPDMAALFAEERDLEIRRREAEALESQPELGLAAPDEDEQARRAREARERMARLRGKDPQAQAPARAENPPQAPVMAPAPKRPDPEPVSEQAAGRVAAAAAAGSRRDLLPNVDEINQTLRSDSAPKLDDQAENEYAAEAKPKSNGFSKGFFLMVVLAGIGIGIYGFAAKITETVPQAGPYLDQYTATVDKGRIWLDEQVKALLVTLDGMSSEAAPQDDAPDDGADPAAAANNGEG